MPVVDGKFECKLSTTYGTVSEGIDAIEKKIQKSRRIRISNIPMSLLSKIKDLLSDKDLMIVLPLEAVPEDWVKKLGQVATTKAKIYVDYKGKEAFSGSVTFSDVVFNVLWIGDEILEVSAMEYSKCVKCLMGTFDSSWHYAQKW